MDFSDLLPAIRQEIKRQIALRKMTQSELARKLQVKPSIVSAYLKDNEHGEPIKNVSTRRLNKLMSVLDLNLDQFFQPKAPAALPDRLIPLVSERTAIRRQIISGEPIVSSGLSYNLAISNAKKNLRILFLGDRFVAIEATSLHGRWMMPMIEEGSTLIIDRYDVKVVPYRVDAPTIYAVSSGDFLAVGYIKKVGEQLELTPHSPMETAVPLKIRFPGVDSRIVGTIKTIVANRGSRPNAGQAPSASSS